MHDPDGVARSQERKKANQQKATDVGRWPANIVHDGSDEVLAVFPQTTSNPFVSKASTGKPHNVYGGGMEDYTGRGFTDSGSAARFFAAFPFGNEDDATRFLYCPKATKAERDEGLFDREAKAPGEGSRNITGDPMVDRIHGLNPRRNSHPTVKPVALMRWLVRLVTPPDGIVLDPFMGSGTTLIAARAEGHTSIGIDLEESHCEIAWGRMSQGVLL